MSRATSAGPSCSPGQKDKLILSAGTGSRVAIVHFTAAPAVGGIERLITAQCTVLSDLGYRIRLIAGSGEQPEGAELIVLPEIAPPSLPGSWPEEDNPAVERLYGKLREALHGCDQCWVHNALTVYLNPILTVALSRLVRDMAALRWVAWCEDISALSSFRDALPGEPGLQAVDGITYVTISRTRQRELAQLLSMGEEEIRVIPPPLDVATWLDLGDEARQIVARLDLLAGEPVVFVPAKLLPHKNLEVTVHCAACLQERTSHPLVLLSGAASPHESAASAALAQRLACLARELNASATFHVLPEIIGATPQRRTIRDLMLLSDLVFLPSAEEGFGIPILEAAALRAPVLCSDIPSFREVGGSVAWYFPLGAPPGEIADRMVDIAASPANQARREVALSAMRFRSQLEELVKAGTVAV